MTDSTDTATTTRKIKDKLLTDETLELDVNELSARLRGQKSVYWPQDQVNSNIFKARYPDKEKLLQMAAEAAEGLVRFWHPWHMEKTFKPEKIGRRIDWSYSPNGDQEWAHALARFTHMLDFAAAYKITGESVFLDAFERHLTSFAQARHRRKSLWANTLDAAIRLMNLIKSYDLIRQSSEFSPEAHLLVYSLFLTEMDLLDRGLGRRVGNWEFFITSSLMTASVFMSENFSVSEYYDRARKRLSEIMESEILPDGNLIEEAPMYHGECILTLLDYLVIRKSNDLEFESEIVRTVVAMTRCLIEMEDPQGRIPQIGDSDAFDVGYISDFAETVLDEDPDSLKSIKKTFSTLMHNRKNVSTNVFSSAGWAVARWPMNDAQTGYLLFDVSGRPPERRNGHSHADDLQFIFHTSEGPILTDPGRFTYTPYFGFPLHLFGRTIWPYGRLGFLYLVRNLKFGNLNTKNWHQYFRNTLSHNTISCDGKNQKGYDNPEETAADVRLNHVLSEGPLFFFKGENGNSYRHERCIVGFLPYLFAVVDRLESASRHDWMSSCHFGKDVEVQLQNGRIAIETKGGKNYLMQFSLFDHNDKKITIEDDWVSPVYNRKFESKTARVKIMNASAATLMTVFLLEPPAGRISENEISVRQISSGAGREDGLFLITAKAYNNEVGIYLNGTGREFSHGDITSDARLAVYHRIGEKLSELGFLNGSFIQPAGEKYRSKDDRNALYLDLDAALK